MFPLFLKPDEPERSRLILPFSISRFCTVLAGNVLAADEM